MSEPSWRVVVSGWDGDGPDGPDNTRFVTVSCPGELIAQKALNALNAFDALLAVATAYSAMSYALSGSSEYEVAVERADRALAALDTAHPDWREWEA